MAINKNDALLLDNEIMELSTVCEETSVKKSYECDFSHPEYFNKLFQLETHTITETEEKPFLCSPCNKGFARKSTLAIHLRCHLNERPYVCRICNTIYNSSSALRKHLYVHIKENRYAFEVQCEFCGKGFYQKSSLMKHYWVHAKKEHRFICEACDCDEAFLTSSDLRLHLFSTHTNEKSFCKICEKAFSNNSDLKEHLRKHITNKDLPSNIKILPLSRVLQEAGYSQTRHENL